MFHVITRKTVLLLLEEKFPGNVKIYKTLTTTNLDTDPVVSSCRGSSTTCRVEAGGGPHQCEQNQGRADNFKTFDPHRLNGWFCLTVSHVL